ncbi:hypothetical protein CCUG62472_04806 [Mycobacteroides salmoniphilum]|nr:hypothetical protein CCUG62472_04806 [Mycobacteroides salmoniphilum]
MDLGDEATLAEDRFNMTIEVTFSQVAATSFAKFSACFLDRLSSHVDVLYLVLYDPGD